ncbi:MAG: hypothetical protein IJ484_09020, partial [Oscillospiraceae bacterium]|nr:hypothetical protein [Oscillospiraceae bacterium]
EEGSLMLAGQGDYPELYRMTVGDKPVFVDGEAATAADLRDGMLVEVITDGDVMATYPAQFSRVQELRARTENADDVCGLLLDVLEFLWRDDDALNHEAVRAGIYLPESLLITGADGQLRSLNVAERGGVIWRFAELHGLEALSGSWQELADAGYINEKELYWEDGVYFEIVPAETVNSFADRLMFRAEKWRSGLGAIMLNDCTAQRAEDGSWSWEPGGFAIA